MRVGLSWDIDPGRAPADAWAAILDEVVAANALGYDSAWMHETRDQPGSCSSPSTFMTAAAARTSSIQLRAAGIMVNHHHHVHLAEETVIVDLFSRGRAGLGFAAASRSGVDPQHLHETIDFVQSAWALDEFRYRGRHIRFPAHTPDSAPEGASEPADYADYRPQWEWGPATPDFLAVTPKPYASAPPVYVEITDSSTLEWAALAGVSPLVPAGVPTSGVGRLLGRYWQAAAAAGRRRSSVEPVVERYLSFDGGDASPVTLAGSPASLMASLRALKAEAGFSHLVWRRTPAQTGVTALLHRFASEVQPLLQS